MRDASGAELGRAGTHDVWVLRDIHEGHQTFYLECQFLWEIVVPRVGSYDVEVRDVLAGLSGMSSGSSYIRDFEALYHVVDEVIQAAKITPMT